MSEQIIEVLEYLGDKLGIAIDWTTENIMPYVEELFKRYISLKITTLSIYIVVGVALCIAAIVLGIKLFKGFEKTKANEEDTLFWEECCGIEPTGIGMFALAFLFILCIASIVILCCNISSLLEWIFIPEVPFVKEIADLIK